MPRRNPPARWVLPEVIDPSDHICVTIPVPNDRQHIAAFWGAILNLASGINWADDPDHKARLVAHVWREIFDSLKPDSCDVPEPTISVDEWEDILSICESLRFHDGKLQGLCCGEWVNIAGQDGLDIGGPDQQGDGAPQPAAGGDCQTYHAKFNASTTYLLPTLVSAGDTLEFTNADGAGHDGSFLATWRCPDGGTFFGGKCLPIYASDGGDPNPAIHHIALVANIDGTYYPAYSGTITVPGGVTNAQVILQVNDDPIADNGGSYSVDVKVCNNALATWTKIFDFTLSPEGFILCSAPGDNVIGEWLAGQGWSYTQDQNGATVWRRGLCIQLTGIAAFNLTSASILFNYTIGTSDLMGDAAQIIDTQAVDLIIKTFTTAVTGTAKTLDTGPISEAGVTALLVKLVTDRQTGGVFAPTGSCLLKSLTVTGSGVNPFAP